MIEDLQCLWKLQQFDKEIYKLETYKISIPKEIEQASQKIKDKEAELKDKTKKTDELSVQRKKIEQDIGQARDTIRRYKSQLLQVKTNREYQTLLHEINTEESKITVYEEERLEISNKIDELSKEMGRMNEELGKSKEKFSIEEKEKQDELTRTTTALQIKKEEREKLILKITRKDYLARYEQVRKNRGGVGIVQISESTCSGCNAVIPPQFIAEIKKGERMLTCEQCGRILIWKKDVD
ncbi:MAG: hypothetical protein HY769_06260 [Candidatus Stahlbacteria bacterium]|nr:hypothetical protein [Candidatus Stahlbacteria bacterium]